MIKNTDDILKGESKEKKDKILYLSKLFHQAINKANMSLGYTNQDILKRYSLFSQIDEIRELLAKDGRIDKKSKNIILSVYSTLNHMKDDEATIIWSEFFLMIKREEIRNKMNYCNSNFYRIRRKGIDDMLFLFDFAD